ncbi:MAG: methyltransferase [Hyphomicrobiaceae bacterium]|nr:methyltransferase [Hyphomicrobiaceae bacterium]
MSEETTLVIERLGAQGDGIARLDGADVFVPFALPGETVRARVAAGRGQLIEVLAPGSPDRLAPVCRHFETCGGCAVQHLAPAPYAAWKRSMVIAAFAARGLTVDVAVPLAVGAGARRRVVLSAKRAHGAGLVLGFHAASSPDIVELAECPVCDPSIVAALPGLRDLAAGLQQGKDGLRMTVVAARNGLDVDIAGVAGALNPSARLKLAEKSTALGLVRLSLDGDTMFASGVPVIRMGTAEVAPPPAIFMQASAAAEDLMAQAVVAALPKKAKRAVDLFCGMGAFTFGLAAKVVVEAFDSDTAALAALDQAARHAQGLKAITARRRDLFAEPLSRRELDGADLVVFDPPRAGAREQALMLAKAQVPVVVAVSCSPATLARDARILVDGGYQIATVQPIDQFVFAPHVEVVAVFTKAPAPRRRPT